MNVLKRYLPQLLMLFSSALWGASFIFTKGLFNSEEAITPTIILSGRMLIATIVTFPFLMLTHKLERIKKGDLKFFLMLAFTEPFMYSLCETGGIKYVSGSLASIIIATIPLFIPFGMALVYKEKLKARAIIGVLLSLIGITLMSLNDDLSFTANPKGLLMLGCAVIIAVIYTLLLVKVLGRYSPITITAYQNLIGLFLFFPLMLILDHNSLPLLSFSPKMFLLIGFLGLFCSTIAYMFFNYGMRSLGATAASVYNNAIPVFSLLLALAIGQEGLTILKVAGMAVVLLGLTVAQGKK
ncbi:MAG: DMT family transporter [Bacteroidales bacterium]|nr:DMT family transporter [Bacteroidales bacterium]